MTTIWNHPSLWLLLGTLGLLLSRKSRFNFLLSPLSFAISILALFLLPSEARLNLPTPFGESLGFLHFSPYSRLFAMIFLIIGFGASVYGAKIQSLREKVSSLLYAAAAIAVTFSGDWITLLASWELMSITSFFLIFFSPRKGARTAAFRYLLIHAFGGSLFLLGVFSWLAQGGSWEIQVLTPFMESNSLAFYCILFGILINAAAVPLHNWLTDSYPKGSVAGSVFLSALTTKSAVFVLLTIFPGTSLLMILGSLMALYGVIYAMMQNQLRKLLAYHIVSQVGFMVAGVGIGTPLALNGAASHAFCHILYKGLLFMAAGAFLYKYKAENLSEFKSAARTDRWLWAFYMIGAVSISGLPGFNGFISKPMILEAAHTSSTAPVWVYYALKLASVGTFLSVALKVPYIGFSRKSEVKKGPRKETDLLSMRLGMGFLAGLCLLLGIYPSLLYNALPYPVEFQPYAWSHLSSNLQTFFGAFLAFWVLRSWIKVKDVEILDFDFLYRKPLLRFIRTLVRLSRIGGETSEWIAREFVMTLTRIGDNPIRILPALRPRGDEDSRIPFPIGNTILWVLGAFSLAMFYLG